MRPPLEHRGRNVLSNDFWYTQRVGPDQPTDYHFDASQGRGIARVSARARAGAFSSSRPFTDQNTTYEPPSDQPFSNTEVVNNSVSRGMPSGRMAGYWTSSSGRGLNQQQTFVDEETTDNHQKVQFSSSQMRGGGYGQPPNASQTISSSTHTCVAGNEALDVFVDAARKMASVLTELADKLDSFSK